MGASCPAGFFVPSFPPGRAGGGSLVAIYKGLPVCDDFRSVVRDVRTRCGRGKKKTASDESPTRFLVPRTII